MKGCSPQVWRHFRELVGDENLLPVAPDGEPHEKSKLSPHNIGKVPSRYDADGFVHGFGGWTGYKASPQELGKWGRNGIYGISVILGRPLGGGHLYAFDIDIDDEAMQETVYEVLLNFMPAGFPWRTRGNSARRLYPVVITGEPMAKKVLSLGAGADGKPSAIEMLGLGQQFVAAGRHPSGAQYVWRDLPFVDDDILPGDIPKVSLDTFELMWAGLQNALPIVSSSEARTGGKARRLNGKFATDETADYLDGEGWVMSAGENGERYLRSPRAHLYSSAQDDGDTSLCYFPAGCGGFERGHFVSLHASDSDLTDTDWLDEFGARVAEFEELAEQDTSEDDTPTFRDRRKDGKVPPTIFNLMAAAGSRSVMGMTFRYDTFTQQVIVMRQGKSVAMSDPLVTRLASHLDSVWSFADPSPKKLLEAILAVAHRDKFDSLTDWVTGLQWDGVPRCEAFFSRVWDMPADDYHHAVGLYFWTALAGRALVPGVQADMAPVLISAEQGKGKSKALRALVPEASWFAAMDFGESRTERIRKMRGKCLVELEEMQGMGRREVGEIRSFITEMVDTTRNAYERLSVDLPRRSVFIATTNDETPFNDGAGNRRWLPMEIADDFNPAGVIPYIEQNKVQLWAEARVLFENNGVMWEAAQTLARPRLNQYEAVSDTTEGKVLRFLASSTMEGNDRWCDRLEISNADIIEGQFPNAGGRERAIAREIGVIMRRLGYCYKEVRHEGGKMRKWVRNAPLKVTPRSDISDFDSIH